MNSQQNFDFLDALELAQIIITLQNQRHILSLADVHKDNDRVLDEIHRHLQEQDKKVDRIIQMLEEREAASNG
jgi:hypothetical protein